MKADKQPPEKLNLRLPQDLKAQLQAYADSTGISLNTACLLAIRNFLPFAQGQASRLRIAKPSTASSTSHPAPKASPSKLAQPAARVGRNELCPCGSGRKAKHCHPENC